MVFCNLLLFLHVIIIVSQLLLIIYYLSVMSTQAVSHSEVIKVAYNLMRKHRLSCDWEFRFNNTKSTVAICNHSHNVIKFSNQY
jgi:hypothetical protein